MVCAVHGVADTLPLPPFNILLSKYCAKAMHLPNRVVVTYATERPTAVMTSRSTPRQQSPTKTHVIVIESAYSNAKPVEGDAVTANDKARV